MARYRGPRLKKCRAVGIILPGLTTAAVLNRPFPPGDHGNSRRSKPSDFKIRLQEKQKARWHFGVLEKQFQRYVRRASRMKGSTGLNLVLLLQSRLDNLVWRMGLARTIPAARQLIVHRHITVDGIRVDRPSFNVTAGALIGIREKSKTKPFILEVLGDAASRRLPSWLEFDPAKGEGKLISTPERGDLPFELNENAIVEFYSQKL
jgi:small subunit ribosomal protein S4